MKTLREYIGKTLIFEWNNPESKTIFESELHYMYYKISNLACLKIKANILSCDDEMVNYEWDFNTDDWRWIDSNYVSYLIKVEEVVKAHINSGTQDEITRSLLNKILTSDSSPYLYIYYKNIPDKILTLSGNKISGLQWEVY